MTISIASVAVIHSTETGYRVAYGSVGPTPLRGKNSESLLNSDIIYDGALNEAVNLDIHPIDDVREKKFVAIWYGKLCICWEPAFEIWLTI